MLMHLSSWKDQEVDLSIYRAHSFLSWLFSAVATAASTAGILFIPPTPDEVITTKCGLVNPVNRIGKFTMVFEGFPRTLDDRESNILEGLVLNAYNELLPLVGTSLVRGDAWIP